MDGAVRARNPFGNGPRSVARAAVANCVAGASASSPARGELGGAALYTPRDASNTRRKTGTLPTKGVERGPVARLNPGHRGGMAPCRPIIICIIHSIWACLPIIIPPLPAPPAAACVPGWALPQAASCPYRGHLNGSGWVRMATWVGEWFLGVRTATGWSGE